MEELLPVARRVFDCGLFVVFCSRMISLTVPRTYDYVYVAVRMCTNSLVVVPLGTRAQVSVSVSGCMRIDTGACVCKRDTGGSGGDGQRWMNTTRTNIT